MANIYAKVETYGQWTYRGAWALEIVAASIGMATGIFLGYRAYAASTETTTAELILASAPFFMVALAELTKIPIATLMYAASWIWKPILFVVLFVLAFITFETVLTGLERAATLRQLAYQELVDEIQIRQEEVAALESEIGLLEQSSDISNVQAELQSLQDQRDRELDSFDGNVRRLDEQIGQLSRFSPEYERLSDLADDKRTELESAIGQRDSEINRRVEEFQSQRDSYVKRMEECSRRGDTVCFNRYNQLVLGLRNPRVEIERRYAAQIDQIQGQLDNLIERRDRAARESEGANSERIQDLDRQKQELLKQRQTASTNWTGRIDRAVERLESLQSGQVDRDNRTLEVRAQIATLNKEINEFEKQRIPMARQDQVRRIAGWVFSLAPEDVNDEQASLIGLVWFGSLSGMAALAGPLTAIVALGLQSIGQRKSTNQESRLGRFLRRWLVRWRFRRVKTIEKVVEKPVEHTIKEILYVPVFTDDPEAARKLIDQDLPPEIRDHVSMAMAGTQPNGNDGSTQHRASRESPPRPESADAGSAEGGGSGSATEAAESGRA